MKAITITDRLILLATGLLAAYQVVVGIDGLGAFPVLSYTIGFGVLLVAGLLIIIMGFEILESPVTIIVSTLIPLSISTGLVAEFFPRLRTAYLLFAIGGFLVIAYTRYKQSNIVAVISLAVVHGIAGLLIFGLPLYLAATGQVGAGFAWVGVGGALIGLAGLLLSFLKTGRPILSQNTILSILPVLLLLTTAAFVAGFSVR